MGEVESEDIIKKGRLSIGFVWDWEPQNYQTFTWKDGLAAAMKELGERHDVVMYTDCQYPIQHDWFTFFPIDLVKDGNHDVLLHWADMTRPHAVDHAMLGVPMALLFAGGELFGENIDLFDHIFVESQVYLDRLLDKGKSASIAFGANTNLFKPVEQPKLFDTIFPATFAAWKRHELYARATKGLRSIACGYMYDTHEQECWEVCLDNGVAVLPHVSADALHRLYAASKVCVIPSQSDGGSQRTVLEAMAMGLPVIVTDSDKYSYGKDVRNGTAPIVEDLLIRVAPNDIDIRQAIDEVLANEVYDLADLSRRYVLDNWSHITYANAIEAKLLELV